MFFIRWTTCSHLLQHMSTKHFSSTVQSVFIFQDTRSRSISYHTQQHNTYKFNSAWNSFHLLSSAVYIPLHPAIHTTQQQKQAPQTHSIQKTHWQAFFCLSQCKYVFSRSTRQRKAEPNHCNTRSTVCSILFIRKMHNNPNNNLKQ